MVRTLIRSAAVASAVAVFVVVAAVAVVVVVVTPSLPAGAAVFEVTETVDDVTVVGSLRWAVEQANADPTPPTIRMAPGLQVELTCAGGGALDYDSTTDQPLVVEGNGSSIAQTCPGEAVLTTANEELDIAGVTISGGQNSGIVGGGDVLLTDSTVTGNEGGPGVRAYTGRATIVRSTLAGNDGSAGGGVGAIHVVVIDSTISGNGATNGGGVWADQSATITNSTVSGNTAAGSGGGVYAGLSSIELTHATIVENEAPAGANVHLDFSAQITATATLLGSPGGGGANCEIDGGATVMSGGYNVTSDGSCGLDTGPDDLIDTDPAVGPLADNGGPTATRLPAETSSAVDRADCAAAGLPADQRGVARPQGSSCDSGAVELQPAADQDPDPDPETAPDPSDPTGSVDPARPAVAQRAAPRYTG